MARSRSPYLGVVLSSAGLALAKAWLFPLLARGSVDTDRARAVWGAERPGRNRRG